MTANDPIRIMASHGWQADEDYLRLFEYLESTTNFFYENVLPPQVSPEGEAIAARRTRVLDAMKQTEVLIVLSGQYEAFRDWLDFQIGAAQAHSRPIVLVEPFGPNDAPDELKKPGGPDRRLEFAKPGRCDPDAGPSGQDQTFRRDRLRSLIERPFTAKRNIHAGRPRARRLHHPG